MPDRMSKDWQIRMPERMLEGMPDIELVVGSSVKDDFNLQRGVRYRVQKQSAKRSIKCL